MDSAAYQAAMKALPFIGLDDLAGTQPLIVLSPHPDDESLGTGGLIAMACARGQSVDIVVLTDGAGSHPGSVNYPAAKLAELRAEETRTAAAALSVPPTHLHHIGLPDTAAPSAGPDFEAAVSRICSLVDARGAGTLFVTWRHDPHCDHVAAADIAKEVVHRCKALRLWAYPIWGWHLPADTALPGRPAGGRLDISSVQQQKHRAIAAHRSQMTRLIDDDPTGFCFTSETLAPFLESYECFLEVQA